MAALARRPAVRWLVPLGVVCAIALIAAMTAVIRAAASGGPLPARSATTLVADLATTNVTGISGTVAERADLGLPAPAVRLHGGDGQGSADWTQLISGSHTLRCWSAGPTMSRVALLGSLGESDIVRNGADVWTWSSADNAATHLRLPSIGTAMPGSGSPGVPHGLPSNLAPLLSRLLPATPQQAAAAILAALSPTTSVRNAGAVTVAGRSAYAAGYRAARYLISGSEHPPGHRRHRARAAATARVREGLRHAGVRHRIYPGQLRSAGRVGLPLLTAARRHDHTGPGPVAEAAVDDDANPESRIGATRLGDRFRLDGHPRRTRPDARPIDEVRRDYGHAAGAVRPFWRLIARRDHPGVADGERKLGKWPPVERAPAVGAHHQRRARVRRRGGTGCALRGRRGAQVTLAVESGLTKRFGRQVAVDGVDLAVPAGSVYGFLGPNGSGKTTTIRMLLGLVRPTAGEPELLGEPMPDGGRRGAAPGRRAGRGAGLPPVPVRPGEPAPARRGRPDRRPAAPRARGSTPRSTGSGCWPPPPSGTAPTRSACGSGWRSPPPCCARATC